MSTLVDRVRKTLASRHLMPAGSQVLVAVSGGPDSVALAHTLSTLAELDRTFTLAGLAHFNHQLRGARADEDEQFCRILAARLAVPIHVGTADVRSLAREERRTIEDAGRTARYAFLESTAGQLGAGRIAVGHTRDDQAETYLLKLLRGAGPQGLSGIFPQRGSIIRPLFDCSRADVMAYLEAHELVFRHDESNDALDNPRNRVRHELIPYLAARFTPAVQAVLAREAEIARADAEYLERQAIEAARGIVLEKSGGFEIDGPALVALPPALAWRVARRTLRSASGGRFVGFAHVQSLLQLAANNGVASLDLPGQRAVAAGGRILMTRRIPLVSADIPEVNFPRFPLSIPGEVQLAELGWTISARPGSVPQTPGRAEAGEVAVEAADVVTPLAVRTRRPGDAFRPLGLGGRKKLQDFFVDRKIARETRDKIPLVVDARDRIIWVVGQRISDDFRVTGRTEAVIILEARRSGGAG